LEQWRPTGLERLDAGGLCRAAQARRNLLASRAPWTYVTAYRSGARSLSAVDRSASRAVAESGALSGCSGAVASPGSGRLRARPADCQARRGGGGFDVERRARRGNGTESRLSGFGRCARRIGATGPTTVADRGAALLCRGLYSRDGGI